MLRSNGRVYSDMFFKSLHKKEKLAFSGFTFFSLQIFSNAFADLMLQAMAYTVSVGIIITPLLLKTETTVAIFL